MSFLTDDWLATLRARADDPAFGDARRALDATAAAYRASLPDLPERQAGYYHDFFCPRHAVQLVFDPRRPHDHACPVDGQIFRGEPFDSAWRWSVNDVLGDAALKLALRAALLEGGGDADEAAGDRERAAAILLGYAECYRRMPPAPRPHPNHPGVVTWSGLDESVWIIRLAWAHALLEEALPPDSNRKVRDDLLRPAAEHLRRVRWPEVHNVTNWNNAALATLALALDDGPLLAGALEAPLGLRAQLDQGVRGDGFWWEGSLSYHYYALGALIWTVRALRASGRPASGDGVLRQMFRAPLAIAFPDLTLPAIHDCWYAIALTGEVGHGIPDAAGFYEVAYGWYADPVFAWILRENYARRSRSSVEALLDGAPTIPEAGTGPGLDSDAGRPGPAPRGARPGQDRGRKPGTAGASRDFSPAVPSPGFQARAEQDRPHPNPSLTSPGPFYQKGSILPAGEGIGEALPGGEETPSRASARGPAPGFQPDDSARTPALGFQPDDASIPTGRSYHAVESGLAVLRAGPTGEDQTYLMLKAGPSARDHGHPDQLSLQLFARGARMTADLGTPGYGIDLNETWYRQTASHSTVLLDGRSQPLASGRIDHFRAGGDVAIAAGSVAWDEGEYAGVAMRRVLFARDDYFIDLFLVACPATRQIDWLYHNLGQLVNDQSTERADGALVGEGGYAHVADVRRLAHPGRTGLRWHAGKARLDLYLPAVAEEELFAGTAPANPASEVLSLLVRRRMASQAVFLGVLAPSGQEQDPIVRGVRWLRTDEPPYWLVVETARGVEEWTIGAEPKPFHLVTVAD